MNLKPDKSVLTQLKDSLVQRLTDKIQEKLGELVSQGIESAETEERVHKLRQLYPTHSPQQVSITLIGQAARKNALTGSLSSMLISGAEALLATPEPTQLTKVGGIGALVSSASADAVATTRVQLQLVYDIACLYGVPYDLGDSDDIWSILFAALGSKGTEKVGTFSDNIFADAARNKFQEWIRNGVSQSITIWVRRTLLIIIAKKMAMRYAARLVPIANIAIGAGANYTTTLKIGDLAILRARMRLHIFSAADNVLKLSKRRKVLIAALVFAALTAEDNLTLNSANLFNQLIKNLEPTDIEKKSILELAAKEDIITIIVGRIKQITDPDLKSEIFNLALTANAVSNLNATAADHQFLKIIAQATDIVYDPGILANKIREISRGIY